MVERCHSKREQDRNPTYIGCTIDKRWRYKSAYVRWYKKHYVKGWHVDKDIVGDGTIYSPDVCVFVPPRINTLFVHPTKDREGCLLGVHKTTTRAGNTRYVARCSDGYKNIRLGTFDTCEEAHATYKAYKLQVCNEVADEYENHPQLDPRVVPAIRRKAQELYGDCK
jgi:hypothetical protein